MLAKFISHALIIKLLLLFQEGLSGIARAGTMNVGGEEEIISHSVEPSAINIRHN